MDHYYPSVKNCYSFHQLIFRRQIRYCVCYYHDIGSSKIWDLNLKVAKLKLTLDDIFL